MTCTLICDLWFQLGGVMKFPPTVTQTAVRIGIPLPLLDPPLTKFAKYEESSLVLRCPRMHLEVLTSSVINAARTQFDTGWGRFPRSHDAFTHLLLAHNSPVFSKKSFSPDWNALAGVRAAVTWRDDCTKDDWRLFPCKNEVFQSSSPVLRLDTIRSRAHELSASQARPGSALLAFWIRSAANFRTR